MSSHKHPTPWRSKCCVEGCSTRVCSGVSMHGFPRYDRYPDLYDHWLEAVRMANSAPQWVPQKSSKVCAFHFETVGNVKIRVPTLFPSNEWQSSAPPQEQDDDYDDEDPTQDSGNVQDDDSDDPMDAYEDSLAVENIITEVAPYEDPNVVEEDPSVMEQEIEEEYNNIVGDVVSTLVTYESVIDGDTVTFNEGDEQNLATLYAGISADNAAAVHGNMEVDPSSSNDVVQELVFNDVYGDSENTVQAHFSPSLNNVEGNVENNELCLVVNSNKPGNADEPTPLESQEKSKDCKTRIGQSYIPISKGRGRQRKQETATKTGNNQKAKGNLRTSATPEVSPEKSESVVERETLVGSIEGEQYAVNNEPDKGVVNTAPENSLLENKSPAGKEGLGEKSLPFKPQAKGIEGMTIDGLILDGEPIKLKQCSVNLVKSPLNPKNKKRAHISNSSTSSQTLKKAKRNSEQSSKKDSPKSPADFLGALSLKSSQEDENSGLRRSARIRAEAGKKRRGGKKSWSVAFKETRKKKLKVAEDARSVSSESVPYDFEADDDPDVAPENLQPSDSDSSWVSEIDDADIKSYDAAKGRRKSKKPKPNPNGFKKQLTRPHSPGKILQGHYHKVRLGDEATQVGLPGSCDGFIFDVVRDDPCNVGVSCNIFYQYQPKRVRSFVSVEGQPKFLSDGPEKIVAADRLETKKPKVTLTSLSQQNEHFECGKLERSEPATTQDCDGDDFRKASLVVEDMDHPKKSHNPGDARIVGEMKVDSAVDLNPDLSSTDLGQNEVEDPNVLSGITRIDDEGAPSSKNGDDVQCNGDSTDESSMILSSKEMIGQTGSVGCSMENVEAIDASCTQSDTTLKQGGNADSKSEPVICDTSRHASLAEEAASASASRTEAMETSEASHEMVAYSKQTHGATKDIDCTTGNIEKAGDPKNDVSASTKDENVPTVAHSSCTDLLEGESPPGIRDSPVKTGYEPSRESEQIPGDCSRVEQDTSPNTLSDVGYSNNQRYAGTEHFDDPAVISSNQNDAPLDLVDVEMDPAESKDVPLAKIPGERKNVGSTVETIDFDGLSAKIKSAEPGISGSRSNDAPMDWGNAQIDSGPAADGGIAEIPGERKNVGGSVETMDLAGLSAKIKSAEPEIFCNRSNDVPMDLDNAQIDSEPATDNEGIAEIHDTRRSIDNPGEAVDSGIVDDSRSPAGSVASPSSSHRNSDASTDTDNVQIYSESAGRNREEPEIPDGKENVSETMDLFGVEWAGIPASSQGTSKQSSDAPMDILPDSAAVNVLLLEEIPGGKDADSFIDVDADCPGSPRSNASSHSEPEIIGEITAVELLNQPVISLNPSSQISGTNTPVLIFNNDDVEETVVISSDDETSPNTARVRRTQGQPRAAGNQSSQPAGSRISRTGSDMYSSETGPRRYPSPTEATCNGRENSQDVFDNVERNLEKMFDMDTP